MGEDFLKTGVPRGMTKAELHFAFAQIDTCG
jgi:hypothetical protein